MAENMIKFLRGNVAGLPQTATAGALYFTKDEGIYMGMEDGSYHRYGEFIVVADVASLPASGAHETCMYYCAKENILAKYDSTKNGWTQINKQPTAEEMKTLLGLGAMAYKSEVAEGDLNADLKAKVNAAAEGNHSHDNKELLDTYTQTEADLADAVAKKHSHSFADEAALNGITAAKVADWDDAVSKEHTHTFADTDVEDAISKKHAHTFVESELNKIADGDVAKWNAVVADHLTSDDKTALENAIKEAKKAGTDANTNIETYKVANDARVLAVEEDIAEITGDNGILAQAKSYSDGKLATARTEISAEIDADVKVVADELAGYKTSNDAALAGVKATAEAAATKEYTDAELAKKVAKTDYEADKATFATKTELQGVDAKFANYKTAADQKLIDDAQDAEIAKKVDKVEGKSLIADSEIARLATLANYDDTQVKADISKKADSATMTTELGKKVDKVEGYSLVSDTEIARLADVDNYDDEEVRGLIGDNAKAIEDLEKYVGTIPAGATATDIVGYVQEKTAGIATEGAMTELGNRVTAVEGDVATIKGDYLKAADIANFETKENVKKVADDLAAYVESNDEALAGVKATAEAARTEEEVNGQIDAKIAALNLATTYEPIGAETRAKAYADGLITDANLDQYTTEAEVKSIVDGVIAGAADSETYNSLTKLVDYIDAHGGEASEMAQAIETLEGDVKGLKEAPSAGIKATDITAWNGEIGAKALAGTKLDASVFTEYSNAHAGDYTNKQIDDAIDADVKAAIDAEVLRANGAYDAKGAAADAQAAAIADAAGKYETKGTAQGIVDALKLSETYEPIGAEGRAIAAAEAKVKALADGQVKTNTEAIATKANAADVYAKTETFTRDEVNAAIAAAVETAHTWGSF